MAKQAAAAASAPANPFGPDDEMDPTTIPFVPPWVQPEPAQPSLDWDDSGPTYGSASEAGAGASLPTGMFDPSDLPAFDFLL